MKPYHRVVPGILAEIPVSIYAGDADYICNWLGNKAWAEELEWSGHKEFKKAKMEDFKIDGDGKAVGQVKSHGNFTFMKLFKRRPHGSLRPAGGVP